MFKKRNKIQKCIKILGLNGMVVYEGYLSSTPINEKCIIQNSIDFFNDPTPCFIHRSAVLNRLFFEFEEYLINNDLMNRKVEIKNLPDRIRQMLLITEEANEVIYYEEI